MVEENIENIRAWRAWCAWQKNGTLNKVHNSNNKLEIFLFIFDTCTEDKFIASGKYSSMTFNFLLIIHERLFCVCNIMTVS